MAELIGEWLMVGARVVIDGVLAVGGRAGGVVEGTVRPGQKEDIGKIVVCPIRNP